MIAIACTVVAACGGSPTAPSTRNVPTYVSSPPVFVGHVQSSSTFAMSASVLGTYIATQGTASDWTLDLLVLMRGTPGWVVGGNGRTGGSGWFDSRGHATLHILQGGLEFDLTFDAPTHSATLNGHPVQLGDDTVLLVEDVDAPQGLRIVGTQAVDRTMAKEPPIGLLDVFRRSPDLVAYLRCDAVPAGAVWQQLIGAWCTALSLP